MHVHLSGTWAEIRAELKEMVDVGQDVPTELGSPTAEAEKEQKKTAKPKTSRKTAKEGREGGEKAKVPKEKAPPKEVPASEGEEDLRKELFKTAVAAIKRTSKDKVEETVQGFGVGKISDIKADDLQLAIETLKELE